MLYYEWQEPDMSASTPPPGDTRILDLGFAIEPQPDETTCGPTSLHAVYRHFGDRIGLTQVIEEVASLPTGGTLAVLLGSHALKRGYRATIYTYNLSLFDPTWFASGVDLPAKLEAQRDAKADDTLRSATEAYLEYLDLGGRISFEECRPRLLRRYLRRRVPVLAGLSATYLYGTSRELPDDNQPDDVRGQPVGHFVLVRGYLRGERKILVADPWHPNPVRAEGIYWVDAHRFVSAVMLGIVTYDANLLVVQPKEWSP